MLKQVLNFPRDFVLALGHQLPRRISCILVIDAQPLFSCRDSGPDVLTDQFLLDCPKFIENLNLPLAVDQPDEVRLSGYQEQPFLCLMQAEIGGQEAGHEVSTNTPDLVSVPLHSPAPCPSDRLAP
jgi:hypothetical protein